MRIPNLRIAESIRPEGDDAPKRWMAVDYGKAEFSDSLGEGWERHTHSCSYLQAIPELGQ
jgi:hypothetical protein